MNAPLRSDEVTPSQVKREIHDQMAERRLGASLARLLGPEGRSLELDFRRLVVKTRRELFRFVSRAVCTAQRHELRIVHRQVILTFRQKAGRPLHMILRFAFFVTQGYVHMVEPMVDYYQYG